ncbi:hypothetical protein BK120_14935 [Paenibacillus sp. FSL A5-0031]|uniref:PIN domain-containing protein n=1 Tax=Paenibacillus sp. FSL A5-0031 TaxID=1920420 RepID=UPI00096F8107|nr:PIN domain-containing protein [Paenibacillus sp. FSL A5-0031]OME83094.1 hypothetical protein BK120_14935 [Paenibacillus sp. FSL A5-0031]
MFNCTHLILDTCVWIDIANHKKELFSKFLDNLEELIESGDIKLVIPDQVHVEWNRNKEEKILKEKQNMLSNALKTISELKMLIQGDNISNIIEILENLQTVLNSNKEIIIHKFSTNIERIDALINNTKAIKLIHSDNVRNQSIELALAKKAPFVGKKKNNMADALIVLSSIEYTEKYNESVFFVSHNHTEFGGNTSKELHNDLSEIVGDLPFQYFNTITDAMSEVEGIRSDLIEMLEQHHEEIIRETREYEFNNLPRSIGFCDKCNKTERKTVPVYDNWGVDILSLCEKCYFGDKIN